jgi:hypothetical protein
MVRRRKMQVSAVKKRRKKGCRFVLGGEQAYIAVFRLALRPFQKGDPDHVASKLSKETIVSKSQFSFLY